MFVQFVDGVSFQITKRSKALCTYQSIRIGAGLPNVQGECTVTGGKGFAELTKNGPFYTGAYLTNSGYSASNTKIRMYYLGFSLEEANTLYGNSETVTPLSESVVFCIKH